MNVVKKGNKYDYLLIQTKKSRDLPKINKLINSRRKK